MRKFEVVKNEHMVFPNEETILPKRSDRYSAGYDFYSKENYTLDPGCSHIFWTDVKVKMFFDNVLMVFARSGIGVKFGVTPRNNVGVIDYSYYGNENNDGNIGICLCNNGMAPFNVEIGDRIAQGVFTRYLITDDDSCLSQDEDVKARSGGFGSSGR